jgi:predicted nucleotidyltransferase
MDQAPTKTTAADRKRLERTITQVVTKLAPEQIILFGSAARKEMTPDSDVDLLVILERLNGEPETQQERWYSEDGNGYEADLILMDRATAEAGRASITRIQGIALDEGQTVYTQPEVEPVPTGPTYWWNGREMVKKTKFEPEEATRLVEDAEQTWKFANDPDAIPRHKCRELQLSMEYALKALTIAQGERVEHKHTLNELWNDVEARGEQITATRDPNALKALTLYSGKLKYESPTPETDPIEIWNETQTTGQDLLAHAKARVPDLIKQATERLQQTTRTGAIGEERRKRQEKPQRPSAEALIKAKRSKTPPRQPDTPPGKSRT